MLRYVKQIYDREDDVVLFRDTTEISSEQSDLKVTITINFNILQPDDYDEEFEILEFNKSKDIDFDLDGWNHL